MPNPSEEKDSAPSETGEWFVSRDVTPGANALAGPPLPFPAVQTFNLSPQIHGATREEIDSFLQRVVETSPRTLESMGGKGNAHWHFFQFPDNVLPQVQSASSN